MEYQTPPIQRPSAGRHGLRATWWLPRPVAGVNHSGSAESSVKRTLGDVLPYHMVLVQ